MIAKKHRLIFLAACIAALLPATPAFAATWTWTGAAGNNSWNNSGNWNPASQPANDGTADITFDGTTRLTPDLTLPWNVHAVNFRTTGGNFHLVSTAGNTLTIGAGGINQNDADAEQIIHKLTLSAAQTWAANHGPLEIDGAVDNGGNLLTIDTDSLVDIVGAISGSGGLIKNGTGSLTLSGQTANTYTGTTTVNAGTLNLFFGTDGINAIPGALNIGDGVGTAIDTVFQGDSDRIADATVSVFTTGYWGLYSGASEAIANLNIVSTGIAGGGLVTLGDGALTILGSMTMTGGTVNTTGTGTLWLGGNLTTNAAGITAGISSKIDLANSPRTFTIADGAALNDLDVTGVVSFGGIIKAGAGSLRLGAANNYTNGTTVNGGTLAVDGSILGAVAVNSGGTLQGIGSVAGKVTVANGGTLSPGNSPGTLSVGSLALNGGSTTKVELGGHTIGTTYDSLMVAGAATLGGTLDVSLIDLGTGVFAPNSGDEFPIIAASGGISGTFTNEQLPALRGGLFWNVAYSSNDVVLSIGGVLGDYSYNGIVDSADYVTWRKNDDTQAGYYNWRSNFSNPGSANGSMLAAQVPEPASALLLISGAATGIWRGRRLSFRVSSTR